MKCSSTDFDFLRHSCHYFWATLFGHYTSLSLALSFHMKWSDLFIWTAVFNGNEKNNLRMPLINKQVKQESFGNRVISSPQKMPANSNDVRPQGKNYKCPRSLAAAPSLFGKLQAVSSAIRPRLSCPFMYPNLVLKVHLCDKMMKMSRLNYFSSIQHDGAKDTQFVFNGIRLWVDSPFCHVVTEIVVSYVNWIFLPISGDGECYVILNDIIFFKTFI